MDGCLVSAAAKSPSPGRMAWNWLVAYFVPLTGALLLALVAMQYFRRPLDGDWHKCYVRAALRMQAGERIHYAEADAYAYPPLMAMLSMPLAVLPPNAAAAAFFFVNCGALVLAVASAWRLVGGGSLLRLTPAWRAVYLIAAMFSMRFVLAPFGNKQFDIIIAALLFAGCRQILGRRQVIGGLLVGLAAGMKCTPLLLLPYLVWRRSYRAAAAMLAAVVAGNLLPDLFWPQVSGCWYVADWVGVFLTSAGREAPGVWFSDVLLNQSLAGFFNRLLQSGFPLAVEDLPSGFAALSRGQVAAVRWLTYGTCLMLGVATWWRFQRARQMTTIPVDDSQPAAGNAPALACEVSALVCLMLLASPMSSKAHYVVLILPALVVARARVELGLRWVWWTGVALLITGPLCSNDLLGSTLGDLTLTWGVPSWHVLLLWWSVWRLLGEPRLSGGLASPVQPTALHLVQAA